MCVTSCSELREGLARTDIVQQKRIYPGSKKSAEDSIQTSQSEDLIFDVKEIRLWLGREPEFVMIP
jgi:hypothetical protein